MVEALCPFRGIWMHFCCLVNLDVPIVFGVAELKDLHYFLSLLALISKTHVTSKVLLGTFVFFVFFLSHGRELGIVKHILSTNWQ